MVLNPGIYSSIDISGGKVRFRPGIYVVAAPRESTYSVRILDGEIEAQGIMFYNTKEGYDPITGGPDAADGKFLPPPNGENKGQIWINAALGFSAINTQEFSYSDASPLISQFNGMLVFQRRRNSAEIQIRGFATDRTLEGAFYARWGKLVVPAGGVFNSQFVVGSFKVPGHADLTVKHNDHDRVESRQVFLVE